MKFNAISKAEKEKMINKMINYVKSSVKHEDKTEDDLYYACKTAGFMFYEFMQDHVE